MTNGALTLSQAASKVHVGLPYTAEIETLNLELGQQGTSFGRSGAVRKVTLYLEDSYGFDIGPNRDDISRPLEWDEIESHYTGELEVPLHGDWNTQKSVVLEQRGPFPLTLLGLVRFTEVGK